MTTRDQEMLHGHVSRTAEAIEAECEARELLHRHQYTAWSTIVDDIHDGLAPEALTYRIIAAREVLELEPLDLSADPDDVSDGLDDLPGLFDDALEIRTEGYRTGFDAEWQIEQVRVCVGLGGPNIFVYFDGSDAWIDGYWGGSKVERYPISSSAVGDISAALEGMMEGAES